MILSREWLSDWVEFGALSDEEFSELITTRVAEVDEVHQGAAALAHARVAHVESVKPHPEKKTLCIASISLGNETREVVCGAPNCRAGMFTAYIAPGESFYPKGSEDKVIAAEREIAGVLSAGVLVSEAELKLAESNEGILDLTPDYLAGAKRSGQKPPALKAGALLAEYLGGPDTLLEIDNKSLTHRPDLWSHFGFARELSAILDHALTADAHAWADVTDEGKKKLAALGSEKSKFQISIEPGSECRRFAAVELSNVKVESSPLWMRRRLFSVGAGIRNVLVDMSNYVMLDIGQPNHAYDADSLRGTQIVVRKAKEGERFVGLDGEERTLTKEDIAITDEGGCVALGGVIGGAECSVHDSTSRLLLESANFDPISIRSTCKRHNLRTDASNRFEKSQSAYGVPLGIQRFVQVLSELQPELKVAGAVADCFAEKPEPVSVTVQYDYIRSRLGKQLEDAELERILTSLGFVLSGKKEVRCEVPYYRATRDISIEDDLVEEIGRIHGYENIPEAAPRIASSASHSLPLRELEYELQDCLSGLGFSEIYAYSFMNQEQAALLGCDVEHAIEVKNPVDANNRLIRTSLIPGMLSAVEGNERYQSSLFLYELGRTYSTKEDSTILAHSADKLLKNRAAFERRSLCLAYSSGVDEKKLSALMQPPTKRGADFFALTSVLRKLVRLLTAEPLVLEPIAEGSTQAARWMHPSRSARLNVGQESIGVIAEVHPSALDDCKNRVVLAEVSLELLLAIRQKEILFSPLSKFPQSFFEISMVAPKQTHYAELAALLQQAAPKEVLRGIEAVAVYEGEPLAEDEKSVSIKLYFGSNERTIGSEELQNIQQQIMAAVDSSAFSLRS